MRLNLIHQIQKCSVILIALSNLNVTLASAGYDIPIQRMGRFSMKIARALRATGFGPENEIYFSGGRELKVAREIGQLDVSVKTYCVLRIGGWDIKRGNAKVDAGTTLKMSPPSTDFLDDGGVEFLEDDIGYQTELVCEGLSGEDATLDEVRRIVGDSIQFSLSGEQFSQAEPSPKTAVTALAEVSATLEGKFTRNVGAYDRNHPGRADEGAARAVGAAKQSTSEAAI